jgi:hypothetical protein
MSTAQRHSPSGSLRHTVTARPGVVTSSPVALGRVTAFVLRRYASWPSGERVASVVIQVM